MTTKQLLSIQDGDQSIPEKLTQKLSATNKLVETSPLTARETDVLCLLALGLTSAQIAEQLVISPLTVNSHVRSIYNKLGATTRVAATRYAISLQAELEVGPEDV